MHCVASSVHELPREFGFTHHPKGALMSWLEMVAFPGWCRRETCFRRARAFLKRASG